MEDEFAELYGSVAEDPLPKAAQPVLNGGLPVHNATKAATKTDEFDDLYGEIYGSAPVDEPKAAYHPPQQHYAAAGATPFAGSQAVPSSLAPAGTQQPQQLYAEGLPPSAATAAVVKAAAAAAAAAGAADEDDEDFDIVLDEDGGPMPAPAISRTAVAAVPGAAAATAGTGMQYSKPPTAAGAAAAAAPGRAGSTHLQYVRGGLEQQGAAGPSLPGMNNAQPLGAQQLSTGASLGPNGSLPGLANGLDRQGSMLPGFGGQQQYSLPGVFPGPPGVPAPRPPPGGPRPPTTPYPGPPGPPHGGVPPPQPPPGAPPAEPPALNYIPMGTAGFQVAAALRDMDAAFPSVAAPDQAIKLPRQHNVDKDEYKEFLNLGHGEIFGLDLDRVTMAPWRAAGADISDFFNYGLTEKTWRRYQLVVARYRAAYNVRTPIEVLTSSDNDDDMAGLPQEIVVAVRLYRQQHPNKDTADTRQQQQHQVQGVTRARGREYKRQPDQGVVITLVSNDDIDAAATAAADAEGQQALAKPAATGAAANSSYIGADYDGPEGPDVQVSGIPKLPLNTIAPTSPKAAPTPQQQQQQQQQQSFQPAPPPRGMLQAGMQQQQQMWQQQQQQQQLPQQRSLQRCSSTAGAGLEQLEGGGDGNAAASGEQVPGSADGAEAQQGGLMRPGRGVQVKLAARPPQAAVGASASQQQQQQQQQQHQGDMMVPDSFMAEGDFMDDGGYDNQQQFELQQGQQPGFAAASRGMMAPNNFGLMGTGSGQFLQDEDFDTGPFAAAAAAAGGGAIAAWQQQQGLGQPGGMFNAAVGRAQFDDVDEFGNDGFGSMSSMQQQMFNRGPGAATGMSSMGMGQGFHGPGSGAGGDSLGDMPGAGGSGAWEADELVPGMGPPTHWPADSGAVRGGNPAAPLATARTGWDDNGDLQQQQQQQLGGRSSMGLDQGRQRPFAGQSGLNAESPDGQHRFMDNDGFEEGDAFGAPGSWTGPGVNGPAAGVCFNCGASDHIARNCPHPKHFNATCHNCGELGHLARDCPKPKRPPPGPGPVVGPPPGSGRACYKCGLEGHMARDCPNPPPPGPRDRLGGPPGRPPPPPFGAPPPPPPRGHRDPAAAAGERGELRSSSACFRCGQEGHLARDCPNPPASPPRRDRDRDSGRGIDRDRDGNRDADREGGLAVGSSAGPTCYKCGQEGHIARECRYDGPPPPHRDRGPPPAGGLDRWDGGASLDRDSRGPLPPPHLRGPPGPVACYNCGQEGHLARDCPVPPRGPPPPHRGPPLPPPRSVFDRLGGGRGGPWDGPGGPPPPGRLHETPEERRAREAEIDRRLRALEGVQDPSSSPRGGSGSGRALSPRDRDRGREREEDKDRGRDRTAGRRGSPERPVSGRKRSRERSAGDDGTGRSSRGKEDRREEKRAHRDRSSSRHRDKDRHKSGGSRHRDKEAGDKERKSSSKHSKLKHRSRSRSRDRRRSRSR